MARVWQKALSRFLDHSRKARKPLGRRRLSVETLEDRSLLSLTPYTPIDLGGTFDRIANTQLYDHQQWTLAAQSTASVAQALADFNPSEVAGMIHFEVGDILTQQQIDDYSAVRTAVLAVNPNCKFDFVIDASTITDEDGVAAIATMTAVNTALSPDLWFFDNYGPAYATNPVALEIVIDWAHSHGQAVGGNVYDTTAPRNSDYAAINDHIIQANSPTGNLSALEVNKIKDDASFTSPLPVIAHLNDAIPGGSRLSEAQVFINRAENSRYWNQAMRSAYITTLVENQASWRYSLMYPIFAPQYPQGMAYDSTQDFKADQSTTTYAQMRSLAAIHNAVDLAATTTVASSSASPQYAGQPLTFTATVSTVSGTPTGTVAFFDGTTKIGTGTLESSGVATLTTTAVPPGLHNIYATYQGDATYRNSTSVARSQTIIPVVVTTSLISGPQSRAYGQAITLTAFPMPARAGFGTPSGIMTFKDGPTVIGTATLDVHGMSTFSGLILAPGRHRITAVYSGCPAFAASTSSILTINISKAVTHTELISSSPTAVVGHSVTFTATVTTLAPAVGTPAGKITFWDGNRRLATVDLNGAGIATYTTTTLSKGNHRIRAVYNPGDNSVNFIGSTSATLVQRILKA